MSQIITVPFIGRISPEYHYLFAQIDEVVPIEQSFADSTHVLWHFEQGGGQQFLKLCDHNKCLSSVFWQLMKSLFSLDLPVALGSYDEVYELIADRSLCRLPKLIVSASCEVSEDDHFSAFILTDFIQGYALDPLTISNQQVEQLAGHIASLHQSSSETAGPVFATPESQRATIDQWQVRLKSVLVSLAEQRTDEFVVSAVDLVDQLRLDDFQLIMPDLRWDQFLQLEDGNLALVDLDAFVWGPKALELVLLEYLLDGEQAEVFKTVYSQKHELPDLALERLVYRVVLFQMNVLGESDLQVWMNHPSRF